MSELKKIDLEKGEFTANGKEYRIHGSLSIERYAEFQALEKELAYGLSVKAMHAKLHDVYQLLNQQRFADSVVLVNDMIRGVLKMDEREPVVLKICSLYCNTAEEDLTTITEDMITEKINDWKKEGLDFADFFQLASGSVNGLHEIYKIVTRTISDQTGSKAADNL